MVPTYGSKGTRRYCYYETRKDHAKSGDPPAARYQRGQLERHLIGHIVDLLEDEHRLRRLTGQEQAEQLRSVFEAAKLLTAELQHRTRMEDAARAIIGGVRLDKDSINITLNAAALGIERGEPLVIRTPLPARKPFREAKLRIDGPASTSTRNKQLIKLLADAAEAQGLVLASPELSLSGIAKREGRCRTQLGRLLRLSWLSPRIVEAIAAGTQPRGLTRASLLVDALPMDWAVQERLLRCPA